MLSHWWTSHQCKPELINLNANKRVCERGPGSPAQATEPWESYQKGVSQMAGLIALTLLSTVLAQEPPVVVHRWTGDPAAAARLARPFRSEDWTIQPPKDAMHSSHRTNDELQYGWNVRRGGVLVGSLSVITLNLRSDTTNPETAADELLRRLKKGAKDQTFDADPLEHGTIQGNRFVRVRFRTTDNETKEVGEGFLYVTGATRNITAIGGSGTAEWIEILQSSVLSFNVIE